MTKIFGWNSYEEMWRAFSNDPWAQVPVKPEWFPDEKDILLAVNLSGDYEESCVIYYIRKDGEIIEFQAGHCSCNGYEGYEPPKNGIGKAPYSYLVKRHLPYPIDDGSEEIHLAWEKMLASCKVFEECK